ncbi:Fe-S cluster assembly protein NifU [Vibrio natriegens]|uniref:Fe-S cluster assembly protein NifU n=1 Tax=Vibrio natriegens TaxID=691 RepID=UPI00159392CB|nr:Fe-S cluster assembly protein NifU [Vibrio natriegens]NVC95011.1 Fe-S cluster assembly protein NifU [Vibrio natriegens]
MWDYSDKVKEHFFHPKNAKLVGDANARGDVGSISCGDALSLTLKVEPDSEVILDAGFQTFGCGSAIASSSALTEMIIGKSLDEAMSITNNDIAEYLDGLPPEKMHCSVMGMEALHAAVANYRGETLEDDHEEGELICKCFAIDDLMIKRVVEANKLTTLEEVVNYTKAGGACTSCHEKIEWVLEDCLKEMAEKGLIIDVAKSHYEPDTEIIAIVESIIEQVRPSVQADGGDVRLLDIEDNIVFVEMSGACVGCGLSGLTLANLEQKITQALGDAYTVFPVQQTSSNTIKKEGSYDV